MVKRPGYTDLGSDCGAKFERWASPADAQAHMDDIQQKLKNYGLGAEYDYVIGRTLVRVADDRKPSEAAAYEDVLRRRPKRGRHRTTPRCQIRTETGTDVTW